jgi:hypothetical protein
MLFKNVGGSSPFLPVATKIKPFISELGSCLQSAFLFPLMYWCLGLGDGLRCEG